MNQVPTFTGCYLLAQHAVCIHSQYQEVHWLCKDYVCTQPAEFDIAISPEDLVEERRMSDDYFQESGEPHGFFPDSYLETLAVYRKLTERLLLQDVLLIHGSVVAVDGQGYMFTAKSGTGKSTHTRFWRQLLGERAVMVNDDKPLLHVADNQVTVFGTPWDGKHRLSRNIQVPLKAICILSRSAENHIQEVKPREVLSILLQQIHIPAGQQLAVLKLIDTLSHSVRFFQLGCNLNPDAARVAFEGMQ